MEEGHFNKNYWKINQIWRTFGVMQRLIWSCSPFTSWRSFQNFWPEHDPFFHFVSVSEIETGFGGKCDDDNEKEHNQDDEK